jgi:hypothetical protein
MQATRVGTDLLLLDQDPALVVLQFFDFARDISQFLGFLPLLLGRQKLVRFKFGEAFLRLAILIFEAVQVIALSRRTMRTSEQILRHLRLCTVEWPCRNADVIHAGSLEGTLNAPFVSALP